MSVFDPHPVCVDCQRGPRADLVLFRLAPLDVASPLVCTECVAYRARRHEPMPSEMRAECQKVWCDGRHGYDTP